MKLNKKLMVLAAAGALGAVTATSAMAFENEFHGMYKLKYFLSNYENGGSFFIRPDGQSTTVTNGVRASARENLKASNYFEQRARIFYTAKANDDLKLVTAFEIDSIFGDRAQGSITTANVANGQFAFRNSGGALESDAVNLETKWVYLDFKIPSTPIKVIAGIQPIKDAFKGTFFDADVAGINTVTKLGAATIGLGYFRAYDQSFFNTGITTRGTDDLDIVALNGDFNINKNVKVGAAYYLYSDNRNNQPTKLHVFGVNADAKIGPVGLSGFAAAQQGVRGGADSATAGTGHQVYNGYAFNAAAKLAVGPGNLRSAFLYTTGDDGQDNINTAWQSVDQSLNNPNGGFTGTASGTNSYNDSNMMLLNRSTNMGGTTTDAAIVYNTNNKNQGVYLYSLGYDATITPKLYANANVGAAWAAKANTSSATNRPFDQNTNARNGSNYLGTEINLETGYKMYDNLTASVQAAYVFLGGYYANTLAGGNDPEDPYTARVVLSYVF